MKLVFSCIFILALSPYGWAQADFETGYVVTIDGDTLKGYIDYRNWDFNPAEISFHGSTDSNIRSFNLHSIRSFQVHQEIYQMAGVDMEVSPFKEGFLEPDPSFHIEHDTVFLRAVVLGIKSLYYYKALDGHENFYIQNGANYDLLEHKKYLTGLSTEMSIRENNRYRGQLNNYLQACGGLVNKLNTAKYTLSSLERLFKYYYDCTASTPDYTKAPDRLPPQLEVFVGGSSSSMQVRNPLIPYLDLASFSRSRDFSAGISLNITVARTHQHWSIDNELLYVNGTFYGHYEESGLPGQTSVFDSKVGNSSIKLHTLVAYNYPVGKFKLSALAGVSNGYVFHITNQLHEVETYYSSVNIYDKKALSFTQKYENGLVFGLGVKMNHGTMGLRYEMDGWNDSKIHIHREYFFLGYAF